MQYKALVSFSGVISMSAGQVRVISDKSLADDLVKAGYIVNIDDLKPKPNPKTKPKTKKGAKKNEDKSD